MKRIYKNKLFSRSVSILIIIPFFFNNIIAIAEHENYTEDITDSLSENPGASIDSSSKNSSDTSETLETEESGIGATPDNVEEATAKSSDSLNKEAAIEFDNQVRLDFSPPSVGDVGNLILHSESDDNNVRKVMKQELLPMFLKNNFDISGKLGPNVGDSIEISTGAKARIHIWFLLNSTQVMAESWYGDVAFKNFQVETNSDAIAAKVENKSDGTYLIKVERIKPDKNETYKLSVKYNYDFSYYRSNMVLGNWYSWVEEKPETIYSAKTDVEIEANPIEDKLTAEPVNQEIALGENVASTATLRKGLVENVKFAGVELSSSDYSVDWVVEPNETVVGETTATVEVVYLKDKTKTVKVDVPIKISWGNALHFRNSEGKSIFAATNNREFGYMRPSKGENSVAGKVNAEAPNSVYISNEIYRDTTSFPTSKNPTSAFNIYGRDDINTAYDNLSKFYTLDTGHILKVYHRDILKYPSLLESYENSVKTFPNNNGNMINEELYFLKSRKLLIPLYINQLKPNVVDIPINSTNEYLDSHVEEFIDTRGYEGISVKFSSYPDTTKAGEQKGKIKATQNGISYEYEITFNVVDERELTAEAINQEFILGSKWDDVDPYNLVKNVQLGNQELDKEEYSVEITEKSDLDTVGDRKAKALITYKKDETKILSLDVPVKMLWGNSIVYGSYDYYGTGRTSAAFTLHQDSTPYITSAQGKDDDNKEIHSNFKNKQYYAVNYFDMSDKQNFAISDDKLGDKSIQANGNDLKKDKLADWGISQKQSVNYGDIVRAWQTETNKNWLYENEQKMSYNVGKQSVYYEITQDGYKPLHFNQLQQTSVSFPIYASKEYLDSTVNWLFEQSIEEYPNISVKGYSEYPNTKKAGDQKAKVIVEETLSTGKKVQYEYDVIVNIQTGDLSFDVPEKLIFKEFSKSKSEQVIQRMYSGDLGLRISDSRGEGKQGNWRLTAQVGESDDLAPYLIFRDGTSQDKYLNQGATEIYSQAKQSNPTEPLNVEVSGQWTKDTGILLKVPPKNSLSSKEYTSMITWNLVEGP